MPADAEDPMVQKALDKITELAAETVRWQSFVNQADALNGRPPRFAEVGAATGAPVAPAVTKPSGGKKWKPGDFYADTLSGAVKRILAARRELAGEPSPANVDDIHEALAAGSYNFDTSGVENQKNSVRISLGKNSHSFVKLPNSDLFGLAEWYGGARKGARKAGNKGSDTASGENEEAVSGGEAEGEEKAE